MEYAATVWSPNIKLYKRKVERTHRAVTKLVVGLRDLTYEERLKHLN